LEQDLTSIYVQGAIGGDAESVEWIVSHFQPLIEAQVRLRLRGLGSEQDVEDIASEVWLVTLRRLRDLRPREGRHAPVLVKFLGTTALQVTNNFLRKRIHRVSGQADDDSGPGGIDQLPAETIGIVSRVVNRELQSVIAKGLAGLAEDKRNVLVLRLMERLSNQEIAQLLDVPPNTVAVRYRRALSELRERLPGELFSELTCCATG